MMPRASCSRARVHLGDPASYLPVHAVLLRASRARHGPHRGRELRARAGRAHLRLRRVVHATQQARTARRRLPARRDGRAGLLPVQVHPVLPQQPRLRDVRAHQRARHLRRRRRVRLAPHDLQRRRAARPLHLPRRAEGRRLRVHRDHRPQPRAAALVVRALDEPHHVQVGSGGARRRGEAAAVQGPRRRAAPRHRLVRDRLAQRLPVLEVALHRSGEDDRRI